MIDRTLKFEIGDYFWYNKHIVKVCAVENIQCTGCIGLTKYASCKKLPYCRKGINFQKQNAFQIRQLKKQKIEIKEWHRK